jgi:hypothetical protein
MDLIINVYFTELSDFSTKLILTKSFDIPWNAQRVGWVATPHASQYFFR